MKKQDILSKAQKESIAQKGRRYIDMFLDSEHPAVTTAKFLLAFAGMGGLAFVAVGVPGITRAVTAFNKQSCRRGTYSEKQIRNSFGYLRRKKLIEIKGTKDGKMQVLLTNKGKKRLTEYSIDELTIRKPGRWDGKWRVLIFDVPSHPKRYDRAREALRDKIKELGFIQIQKSVWAYPYECEDEILFVAEMYQVERYIEFLVVEKFLHEAEIRKHFPELC